ncbi:tripartite tricarboxylate transporter TctB family protein [Fusibacter paucivorans]|uniref:Tripartite tricarboxylate transporter TctB family protein n=1 Tax=Fusibacter paucivorans TaxID=76009 RepID=A0ABS5PSR9_9FIRM|nr:tripartite tricarboxylate transporter TctB family protein [Fusibacter paucivorans]MBS7527596.1 tripartite tricarboxylate transporter TctB family protein [Fusibacter paucivorans]
MKTINIFTLKTVKFLYQYASIVIGVVLLIVSSVMMYFTKDITVVSNGLTSIDNAVFMPRVVFGALILLSPFHIVAGVRRIKTNISNGPSDEEFEEIANKTLRSLTALLLLIVYVWLVGKLGFIISAILYLFAAMMFMTKKENRKPILYVVVSAILVIIVYYCFKHYLYINLPNGILKGVF